jgi:hypothetical protein
MVRPPLSGAPADDQPTEDQQSERLSCDQHDDEEEAAAADFPFLVLGVVRHRATLVPAAPEPGGRLGASPSQVYWLTRRDLEQLAARINPTPGPSRKREGRSQCTNLATTSR